VSAPNRVTPFGEIVAIPQRGMFMGNRGSIHREREIVRPWQTYDEAVALAAGHRPCALCRRADYNRWLDSWEWAFGERPSADAMDLTLHEERLDDRSKRLHSMPWARLPSGAFASVDGRAVLVQDDRLVPWSSDGYGSPIRRPANGDADVLTPPSTVAVIRHGYRPTIHPSAEPV
jgi:hypothetical protein